MAGLDPSIILRDISPKFEPYENVLAKQMQIKAAQQQYDDNAFKLQQDRETSQQQNALAQFMSTNPNLNDPATQAKLYGVGGVKLARDQIKSIADVNKIKGETDAKAAEAEAKVLALHRDALAEIQNPQDMAKWMVAIRKDPRTQSFYERMGSAEEAIARIPQTPQEFNDFRNRIALGMTKYTEQNAPKYFTNNLGDRTVTIGVEGMTGKANQVNSSANGQSPDNKASVGASMANAAATRDVATATRDAAKTTANQATEMKFADDYRTQSKDFKAVGDAYRQINATLDSATKSPAATLAAATKFMKLLDPGSVVRESELGMALAATGVFDRATNYVNTLQSGRVLTPNQVKDFKAITEQIYNASQEGQRQVDDTYKQYATANGLRPEMILQDLGQNRGKAAVKANQDSEAMNWAKANPNDPRAAKILQHLGR